MREGFQLWFFLEGLSDMFLKFEKYFKKVFYFAWYRLGVLRDFRGKGVQEALEKLGKVLWLCVCGLIYLNFWLCLVIMKILDLVGFVGFEFGICIL